MAQESVVKHETLFTDRSRAFVKVGNTWYDTNKELQPIVDQPFLAGRISEVLSYDEYVAQFGEKMSCIFDEVNDRTKSSGFLRKVVDEYYETGKASRVVRYGINVQRISMVADSFDDMDF